MVAEIRDGQFSARGEGTPIYYNGETAENCLSQIEALPPDVDRESLQHLLPPGAARNAVDCAFWELESKRTGLPVWRLAGLSPPEPLVTALTVSVDRPERMESAARATAERSPLIKVKLAGENDLERVEAVRRGAPNARLIVDANEAWSSRDIAAAAKALVPFGVELIEQPVRRGEDHLLEGIASPISLGADESLHDRSDLARCRDLYHAVNIKLDKAGGLTEALLLKAEAEALGLKVMVGCMLATSRGIAPAFLAAQGAQWTDLDGALLLANDRDERLMLVDGRLHPPGGAAWGIGS